MFLNPCITDFMHKENDIMRVKFKPNGTVPDGYENTPSIIKYAHALAITDR